MLPCTLLWLILQASVALAQQPLSLGSLSNFTASTLPNPPTFALPSSSSLSVSVALCASSQSLPRFFVTNNTAITVPGATDLAPGTDVFEIVLNDGYGSWTGMVQNGGVLAVSGGGQTPFEVGVSDDGPVHRLLSSLPLLGDTTSNQALIFSPSFSPPITTPPTYPNYTLPPANLSMPTQPSTTPDFTLLLAPTASSPNLTSLPQTACALSSAASSNNNGAGTGNQIFQSFWLRDQLGWRSEWLMGGLTPLTNYTAYVVTNQTKLSGPIYFTTKSPLFSCPLVHSLPYCPSVSYAVPLPPPPLSQGFSSHDSRTLPSSLTDPMLSYLTNFTVMLQTMACGRDIYSPLKSCEDCEREYRKWLCNVWFVRCGEDTASFESSSSSSSLGSQASAASQNRKRETQTPLSIPSPALMPIQPSSRNRFLPSQSNSSLTTTLLPCIESCTAVDRSCPYFLSFQCPLPQFNANASYGVGFVDGVAGGGGGMGTGVGDSGMGGSGIERGGVTGYSQDRWGNVWCAGPGLEQGAVNV